MKLMVIPHLPSFNTRGYRIADLLSNSHEVHFILWDMPYPATINNLIYNIKNSIFTNDYKKEKIFVHKVLRLPFFFPVINKLLFKIQLRKIFENHKIDCIISETYFSETEPPLDLPLIYDMVDDHEEYAKIYGSIFYKLAFRILRVNSSIKRQIYYSKKVLVVSNILKNKIQQIKTNIHLVPNFVEPFIFSCQFKSKTKENRIVYVSNFGPWSKLFEIVFAIQKVKKTIKNIELVLVGDGIEVPNAKKLVNKLGLENHIKFIGLVQDREKVFEIINSADLCLNICEKNKFRDSASPMKVFEYSALGKKVLSTNLAEVELLNFGNVMTIKNDDDIADAIINCLRLEIDKEKTISHARMYSGEKILNVLNKHLAK